MYAARVVLVAAFVAVTGADNSFLRYELECNAELGSTMDPCQKACELTKRGMMRNGKFDIDQAIISIDAHFDEGAPVKYFIMNGIKRCHHELSPLIVEDKCLSAAAMFYCIRTNVQSSILQQKNKFEKFPAPYYRRFTPASYYPAPFRTPPCMYPGYRRFNEYNDIPGYGRSLENNAIPGYRRFDEYNDVPRFYPLKKFEYRKA